MVINADMAVSPEVEAAAKEAFEMQHGTDLWWEELDPAVKALWYVFVTKGLPKR